MARPAFTDSNLVRAIFHKFDKDGNGHLDEPEFKRIFHLLGIGRENSDTIFKIIDKDDSKCIDSEELLNWLFAAGSTDFVGDDEGHLETSQDAAGRMRGYQEVLEDEFELGKGKKSRKKKAREAEEKRQLKETTKEVDTALRLRWDLDGILSEELEKQFKAYDRDGNRNISLEELIEVAKAMDSYTKSSRSEKEITDQANLVFQSMDKDGNGQVDMKEYIKTLLRDVKRESSTNEEAYARISELTKTLSKAIARVKRPGASWAR